jgi:hypothetical protein
MMRVRRSCYYRSLPEPCRGAGLPRPRAKRRQVIEAGGHVGVEAPFLDPDGHYENNVVREGRLSSETLAGIEIDLAHLSGP